jgi:hypothetical protein
MRLRDIHATVESLLGRAVSKDSIEWCLRMSTDAGTPRFVRVAYGRYRLFHAS